MNSKTSTSGVGFYMSDNIGFATQNDLQLSISENVEKIFELKSKGQTKITL